jgi:hemerythrin-like domain-containing protein/nucleotide-binding universal stress UspA family protein
MYRHFLVPIDGSALSKANVSTALEVAKSMGARITFLHAQIDYSSTDEGALFHALAPEVFEAASLGDTNVVLAKAMASAQYAGLTCEALACTSSRPAEAIVETAVNCGADLIVMASRGARGFKGWLHSSQTERVLRNSPVALLVTRVGAGDPLRAEERALGTISDEHRSIAVAMQCLSRLGTSTLEAHALEQIRLVVDYLKEFPQRLHHPKEEAHLHRLMRLRHAEVSPLLDELEAEHVHEGVLIEKVRSALAQVEQGDSSAADTLRSALLALTGAIKAHLSREETQVFPMAKQYLQEADWTEIANAFESNEDSRIDDITTAEFDRLFARIANLTMRRLTATAA